jgi:hypothetical protein
MSTLGHSLRIKSDGSFRTRNDDTYPYIELSNTGMQLKDADDGDTYGTGKYGTAKYGWGASVWIMNTNYWIPWMEVKEPKDDSANDMPSFRFYNRSADPAGGSYQTGDLAVVSGKLKIYTGGSWVVVGTQS